MSLKIKIDPNLCKLCKVCTEICPNVIFKSETEGISIRPERINLCFACGQCMAACSEKAIQIDGLSYEEDFFEFSGNGDVFQNLIESRRSIRAFKDKPIPKEDLEKIVEAISFSPPSFPPLKMEIVVVQDKKTIQQNLPEMIGLYDKLMKGLKSPIGRFIIKRKLGVSKFNTLINHLVPLLTAKLPNMKAGSEDAISRNAQALLIFHANKNEENYVVDINIALSFALLKAHSLGIGACVVELVPPPLEKVPGLKQKFGIPGSNEVVASIILGYPKFKYKRGIRRNLKSVKWIGN
jgi:nitroreductase/NAD-dependent dihydropyrimidine dehydrogenase PreA subunit